MANTLKICGETYTGVNGLIVKDDNGNEIILQDEASIQSALDDFVNGTLTTYIDSSLTSFANYAFQNFSSLQTVITPNVTSIGNYAFQNCSNLSSITTGSLTSIGDYCF